ncbi:MAG TPA: WYL domain-containing protein [Microlunatus sp.]|nr:WYL domain-containing protein [Microlunatus sp.]
MAIYGERVALLPQLLQVLHYHPQGMRLTDLAHEVGRSEADVRETLRVYHLTDLAHYLPNMVARPDVLQFLADDPEDDGDPALATRVRLGGLAPGEELGVTYVRMAHLARLYRVASDALSLSPDDSVLASAVGKLADGVLPGFRIITPEPWAQLDELRTAIRDHRRINITYARAWSPVIEELVIEPHLLIRTRRGWELDASPGDARSSLRTYLLANIRSLTVLSETFVVPDDLTAMITKHRTDLVVIMEVPHRARWAVDKYAERVEFIEEGAELTRLKVRLLRPYRLRVGLMLVAGGPSARVIEPVDLRGAGAAVAQLILGAYETSAADA